MVPVVVGSAIAKSTTGAGTGIVLSSLVGRVIDAYTRGKELEVQKAAIEAKHQLDMRELDIQEKALEWEMRQQDKRLSAACKVVEEFIARLEKGSRIYTKTCADLRLQLRKVFNVIIDDKTNSERRSIMMGFYDRILQSLSKETEKMSLFITQFSEASNRALSVATQNRLLSEPRRAMLTIGKED